MARYGIDVSAWQGTIDWQKVRAAGCGEAVIKITRRDLTPDRQFRRNFRLAGEAGLTRHVYRYVYENSPQAARKAAEAVLDLLAEAEAPGETAVWWDVEDETIRPGTAAEEEALVRSILAARERVEGAGYPFGVYCGYYWYQHILDRRELDCPFWVARYPTGRAIPFGQGPEGAYRPETSHTLWGWQYSSYGKISGIGGWVDLNEIYGLPISPAPGAAQEEEREEKEDPILAFQRWLNGQGEALEEDGLFGPRTRRGAVRVLQRTLNRAGQAGLSEDGIFGPKTAAALPALGRGDRGDLVILLQGLLYGAGEDPRGLDGIFGPGCQEAVLTFQRKQGLTADGLAGRETFGALAAEQA